MAYIPRGPQARPCPALRVHAGLPGLLLLAPFTCGLSLALLLLYALLILIDSTVQSRSLKVGFLAVAAVFVQLIGYGIGFLESLVSGKLR